MHHTLKTHPAPFRAVRDGRKRFEVRKDDRMFQCGDTVTLQYYDARQAVIPGLLPDDDLSPLDFRIGFVLRGGQFGVEPGFVVFQLEPLTP